MSKVFPAQATNPEPRVRGEPVLLVTDLEAQLVLSEKTILVRASVYQQEKALVLALSPPAAHQLSETLAAAVAKYLESTPGKPFDVGNFFV